MIVDRLKNYKSYAGLNSRLDKAFEFLSEAIGRKLPEGRYDIEGDKLYAMVQKYATKPAEEKKWEAHVRYIDLQYMAGGQEVIQWAHLDDLAASTAYDEEKDCTLYDGDPGISVKMEEEFFTILFPQDAHKPGCILDKPRTVEKIVIKIKLEE